MPWLRAITQDLSNKYGEPSCGLSPTEPRVVQQPKQKRNWFVAQSQLLKKRKHRSTAICHSKRKSLSLVIRVTLAFPGGPGDKEFTYNARGPGPIPGRNDLLEKGMATQSSILALESPWTEEPGYPWGHKELDTTEQLSTLSNTMGAVSRAGLSLPWIFAPEPLTLIVYGLHVPATPEILVPSPHSTASHSLQFCSSPSTWNSLSSFPSFIKFTPSLTAVPIRQLCDLSPATHNLGHLSPLQSL